MTKTIVAAAALCVLVIIPNPVKARGHLICGWTAMHNTGERNPKYARALAWLDKRHTNPHPGAVAVFYRRGHDSAGHRGGHVAVIQSVLDRCEAVVRDERGTYQRNICRALAAIVEP